jgi:hypothetical protein
VLSVTCYSTGTGVTAGERSDTETVTLRSERGDWKRAVAKWYLASRLLNLGMLLPMPGLGSLALNAFTSMEAVLRLTSVNNLYRACISGINLIIQKSRYCPKSSGSERIWLDWHGMMPV